MTLPSTRPSGASRRRVLAALALAPAVATAGCAGVLAPEFAATPVVLPATARTRLGYREVADESIPVRATVGVASATLRSHLAAYGPAGVDDDGGATPAGPVVAALATPDAEVAGRPLNPLVDAPVSDLVTGTAVGRLVDAAGVLAGDAAGVVDGGAGEGLGGGFEGPGLPAWETPPEAVALPTPVVGRVLDATAPVESFVGRAGVDGGGTGVVVLHLLRVRPDDVVVVAGVHGAPEAGGATADGGDGEHELADERGGTASDAAPRVTFATVAAGATDTVRVAAELVRRAV